MPCWLQLPAVSVACAWLFRVLCCIYVYIYIYSVGCVQGYILPYIHICRSYMHIWSLEKKIYGIHLFAMFVCVCAFCMLNICKWVQIGANACFVAHHLQCMHAIHMHHEIAAYHSTLHFKPLRFAQYSIKISMGMHTLGDNLVQTFSFGF